MFHIQGTSNLINVTIKKRKFIETASEQSQQNKSVNMVWSKSVCYLVYILEKKKEKEENSR